MKWEDKRDFVADILRAAKARGIKPPPLGLFVQPGNGRCMAGLDKVVCYRDAPVENWMRAACDWVEYAVATARSEAVREANQALRTPEQIAKDPENVYGRFGRLELDEEHAPNAAKVLPHGAIDDLKGHFSKIEMD